MSTRTAFSGVRRRGLAPAWVLVGVWAQTLVATTSSAMPASALQTAFIVLSFLHGGDCERSLCRIHMHAIRSPYLSIPRGCVPGHVLPYTQESVPGAVAPRARVPLGVTASLSTPVPSQRVIAYPLRNASRSALI